LKLRNSLNHSIMKCYFLFFLTVIQCSQLFAQTEPDISVNLLSNDKISEVNANESTFVDNVGKVIDLCKTEFKKIDSSQKIAVLLTYHKAGKPSIELYSNPKISAEAEKEFQKKVMALKTENTILVDFPLLITLNVKDGNIDEGLSGIVLPDEKVKKEYGSADLKQKYELNKAWAINEILPVLSAYQIIVDDKFAGVKNFGKLVSGTNFNNPQDINELTSKNSDYWRATMEMGKGNQLIPVTKIFMLIAQGQFDYAIKYIEIIPIFSDKETIADHYLQEAKWRLKSFNAQLNDKIDSGIKEHDAGNYQKAIGIYNAILAAYPNAAWVQYEKYYSQNAIDLAKKQVEREDRELWDKSKIAIYKSNPLYNLDVRASNGKEAYLLFRRQEIASLFKDNNELLKDIFKYADIALDLQVYDFAAQLFWLTSSFDNKSPESLNYYLYCLEKLNIKNFKEAFNGDFEKEFEKIEQAKEKEMKASTIYNSMKN
jgi:hypothetical protein